MTPDHPRIRKLGICPLCGHGKDQGLVVCWPCYRQTDMRNGNPEIDAYLDRFESKIALAQSTDR